MNNTQLQQLGLQGSFVASKVNDFTDRSLQRSSKLKDIFLDIENVGKIKFIEPRIVLRYRVENQSSPFFRGETYATWKVPNEYSKYYFSKYKIFTQASDYLGLIHFGLNKIRPEDNSFFRKSLSFLDKFKANEDPFHYSEAFSRRPWAATHYIDVDTNSYEISGLYRPTAFARNDLEFARLNYPKNVSGTSNSFYINLTNLSNPNLKFSECPITGHALINLQPQSLNNISKFFNTGSSGANQKALQNKFESSLYNKNYMSVSNELTSGIELRYYQYGYTNTQDYSSYNIPYPNTVDKQNFYRFGIPTKICVNSNYDNFKINGLLIISTGNPVDGTDDICYVSPHVIAPKTVNVIEDYARIKPKMQKKSGLNILVDELVINTKIFQTQILSLTSEFNSNTYGSGIKENNVLYTTESFSLDQWINNNFNSSGLNLLQTPISGTRRFCAAGQHLKQDRPLMETPFYKFYNNLYTGTRTLNTGTWNGIVPSGAFVSVELISTTFGNSLIGMNRDLCIVYSGQGTFDNIDKKLFKNLNTHNFKKLLPRVEFINNQFSFEGRASSFTENSSRLNAKAEARKQINKFYNKMIKIYMPEIIISNRKSRKYAKYLDFMKNKQLTCCALQHVPTEYVVEMKGAN